MSNPMEASASITDIPTMRIFQLDAANIGAIQNSVNLYRGDVVLPLTLATLPGRNGMDVSVTALYNSHVQQSVTTWNLDAPTGILGLGWTLGYDRIIADGHGSSSRLGCSYYLYSQGVTTPLLQTDAATDPQHPSYQIVHFALQDYRFWQITYYQSDERWEIIKEDGVTAVYGGAANDTTTQAIQWGITRNNWVGSSNVSNGAPYAVAWNLASLRHFWGDTISFCYSNDTQPVDAQASTFYTRASYLVKIVDVYSRTLDFTYAEKNAFEYQAPHVGTQGETFNPYQDRYETLYLAAIQANNPTGQELFSTNFMYDFLNVSATPGNAQFTKRCLTAVAQIYPPNIAQPSLQFSYITDLAVANVGALQTITYPDGGTITYTYQQQPIVGTSDTLNTRIDIANPSTGAIPRVWYGANYVVITWYDASAQTLTITPYTWGGNWYAPADPQSLVYQLHDAIDVASLMVVCGPDFFALAYQLTTGDVQLALFHQDPMRPGEWVTSAVSEFPNAGVAVNGLVAGDCFVVFHPTGTQDIYQYTWYQQSWQMAQTTLPGASSVALGAQNNVYLLFAYPPTTLEVQYHDGNANWAKTVIDDPTPFSAEDAQTLTWAVGNSFATCGYWEFNGGVNDDAIVTQA